MKVPNAMRSVSLLAESLLLSFIFLSSITIGHGQSDAVDSKVRIGIAGLTHGHVHWILGRLTADHFEVVGISESNLDLAKRLSDQYGFSMNLVYSGLEEMVEATNPDGVLAFNSIKRHLEVVRVCAPRGIDVMVEKPLAASLEDAQEISKLAKAYNISVLTNYETSWYSTTHFAYKKLHTQGELGQLRKIVVHDGHQGPQEIGVGPEFLEWLTDPKENGGGAVIDFGCYGANLMTWLMKGQRPLAVQGILQQLKPEIYPSVDDEATIVLTYPGAQGIIQASWNWPYSRKDMELYGTEGALFCENGTRARAINSRGQGKNVILEKLEGGYADPFTMFSNIIRGEIALAPYDLLSIENNLIVMEILDAAIRSSHSGRTITLDRN
jgi:predicted dehydrogenase